MRYANLFLGNQLIQCVDALTIETESECEGDEFRCVCCDGIASFSKAHTRNLNTFVKQHFKHQKALDPALVKRCEERVARMTETDFRHRAISAKNRRERVLAKRFWPMFSGYYDSINFPVSNMLEADMQDTMPIAERAIDALRLIDWNYWQEDFKTMLQGAFNKQLIVLSASPDNLKAIVPSSKLQESFHESVRSRLSYEIQYLYGSEVIDFLKQKSSIPKLKNLAAIAISVILDAMRDGDIGMGDWRVVQGEQVGINMAFLNSHHNRNILLEYIRMHICLWIALLPWAKEYGKEFSAMENNRGQVRNSTSKSRI